MKKFDVAVIGAGPAGSTAASILASAGFKTALLDKHSFPRQKLCGGGVTARAFDYLPIDINNYPFVEINDVLFKEIKTGIEVEIKREAPFIFMVDRSQFDYYLVKKSIEQGAEFFPNVEVIGVENNIIKTTKGEIQAEIIIAADGANGYFAKRNRKYFNFIPAVEAEISLRALSKDSQYFKTRFDFGVPEGGYSWVFPKKGSITIGSTAIKKGKRLNLKKNLLKYAEGFNLKLNPIEIQGYFVPLQRKFFPPCKSNILITGDALGIADPVTLEGISLAILTGKLAAESAILSKNKNELLCKTYNDKIKVQVYKELKYARWISNAIYGSESIRVFLMKHYGFNLANKMTDVITNSTKYSSEFTKPYNFLKLIKYLKAH
jgi:geranylgeranyl reductase family protein